MERTKDESAFTDPNWIEVLNRRADDLVVQSTVDDLESQGIAVRVVEHADGTATVFRAVLTEPVTDSETDTESDGENGEGQNGERENQKGISSDEIGRTTGEEIDTEKAP